MSNREPKGGKVFEVVTQLFNQETGEPIITLDQIEEILKKYKSIDRYAYVLHDKDFLTKDEITERFTAEKKQFTKEEVFEAWVNKRYKRIPHVHVVFETPRNYFPKVNIAKWFGLPPNFVRVKTGRGAFMDAVQYLTHEDDKQQDLGKYRYPDDEIHSNFGWRDELNSILEEKVKFGRKLDDRERLQIDVLYHGLTLREARKKDPYNYNKDLTILKRNRADFLTNQTPPPFRLNLYIEGSGGVGKDIMAKSIARSMYPDILDLNEVVFEVGGDGVSFDGYDGQPVIIWTDVRAGELLGRFGRENVLGGILEPFQGGIKRNQNVKYSSVSLVNSVNIFTGADKWTDFLNGLVSEYTDRNGKTYKRENKAQSYRRFPLIIPVSQIDFDIMLNNGFMNDNNNWEQYFIYKNVVGNFAKASALLSGNEEKAKEIEDKMSSHIIGAVEEIQGKTKRKELTDEEIEAILGSYGEAKTGAEIEAEREAQRKDFKNEK